MPVLLELRNIGPRTDMGMCTASRSPEMTGHLNSSAASSKRRHLPSPAVARYAAAIFKGWRENIYKVGNCHLNLAIMSLM